MRDHAVEDVDLLVIGGGKAGKSLAMDRAKAGWKVAMVEREKIGGTCINVACIPTKALVGSARTMLMARHANVLGVEVGEEPLVSIDGLRQHKSSVVNGMVAAHKNVRGFRHGFHLGDCLLHRASYGRDQDPRRECPVPPRNRGGDQHWNNAGSSRSARRHRREGMDLRNHLAAGTNPATAAHSGRWIRRL